MSAQDRIDMDIFKVVSRAIPESASLERMTHHMGQLLVGALGLKGCNIFALNPETDELEVLGGFGLSIRYMNKGPVLSEKGLACRSEGEAVVIADVVRSKRLQYPDEAVEEGIAAIVSVPICFSKRLIGCLRLYHGEIWSVSERDLDSLHLLAEHIGLAMMYSRVSNALSSVKDTVDAVHTVWLENDRR